MNTSPRIHEGIRTTPGPEWLAKRSQRSRVPALTSLVSRCYAAYAMNGAIKALDAPGNPFTVEFPNTK